MLILLFLLLFLFFSFLFFLTVLPTGFFVFSLLQFLMPVYNVKLFLQHVAVTVFKYFFFLPKDNKAKQKAKEVILTFAHFAPSLFILLPAVFYDGYCYHDDDDDRYIHIYK